MRKGDVAGGCARVDEASRTIYVVGDIDGAALVEVLAGLRHLASKKGDIFLVLASNGGGVDEGMAMYDAIKSCPRRVIAEVYGYAQSMAVLVLQAATERRLSYEARLLVHDGEAAIGPTTPAIMDATVREMQYLDQRYYEILAWRSEKTPEEIRELCKAETYLSAEEAIGLGLADTVLQLFNPELKRGRMKRKGRRGR